MNPFFLKEHSFKRAFSHIKWWLLYGVAMSVINIWGRPFYYTFGFMALCLLMALVFYTVLGVYRYVPAAYRIWLYVVVMIAMQWLLFLLLENALPRVGITLSYAGKEKNIGKFLLFGLNIFFDIVLAAIAYIKHVNAIRALEGQLRLQKELHEKEVDRLKLANLALERELERRKAESAQWVTTMNAHVVRNAYNAIYEPLLAQQKIADGLLALKAMHEYVLENAPGQTGMVPLRREIEMLNVWTEIYALGHQSCTQVDIEVESRLPPIFLPSFSYIAFLENSYEHGEVGDPDHRIRMRIGMDQRSVHFSITNRKKAGGLTSHLKNGKRAGLGIEGVKQRLELAGIPANLSFDDNNDYFSVTLSIDYTKLI